VGRPERPIDPDAGPRERFAYDLRLLRQHAGQPSYRELAKRAHYSDTTLSVAAAGTALPSLEVTLAFVAACGGDVEEWSRRWHAVDAELGAAPPAATVSVPAAPAAGEPIPRRRWRRRAAAWGVLAVALALAGSAVGITAWADGGQRVVGPRRAAVVHTLPSVPGADVYYRVYNATAGPGCPAQAGASFAVNGRWRRQQGSRDGGVNCRGVFLAASLSGSPGRPASTAEWAFSTRGALRYSLSFWVPRVSGAAGPVVYDLLTAGGRLLTRYTINQSLDAGLYVTTPAYHLTGGQLRVRLASTGLGSAVIIAASVNVGCS
jgi:hypothetical protein